MELFSKKNLAIASGVFGIWYAASTFIGGLGVEVVLEEPSECLLLQELKPIHYTDNRFLTALVQKKRAKNLGGDTVYLPLSITYVSGSKGYLHGTAYDCSSINQLSNNG